MRERPILFSGPMVRAILEGPKTQTRRIVKPQPKVMPLGAGCWYPDADSKRRKHYGTTEHFLKGMPIDFCPYGKPGDRLWVRETFASLQYGSYEDMKPSKQYSIIRYKATDPLASLNTDMRGYPYRPSIHMPRWASRINLEVVSVWVERLQEITDEDILHEGFRMDNTAIFSLGYQGAFELLWDSINKKDGTRWQDNPWVWVVEFKREES